MCYWEFSDMLKALDTIDYVKKTDITYFMDSMLSLSNHT